MGCHIFTGEGIATNDPEIAKYWLIRGRIVFGLVEDEKDKNEFERTVGKDFEDSFYVLMWNELWKLTPWMIGP